MREIAERAFETYVTPVENIPAFKYLGQVVTAGNDDWYAVVGNPQIARKIWGQLLRILSREGADPKVSGKILKAVTQAVLLFSHIQK